MNKISKLLLIGLIFFSSFSSAAAIKVKLLQNLPYGLNSKQKIDIYLSSFPIDAKDHLAILMLPDRTEDKADKAVVTNKMNRWIQSGVIFATANYSTYKSIKPMTQVRDAAKALTFLQRKVLAWGGDPTKIIVMGYGSGAYIASLLTSSPEILDEEGALPWLGTVSIAPMALDVATVMVNEHPDEYDSYFGDSYSYWTEVSPARKLESMQFPTLFVCSTFGEDPCFEEDQMKLLATKMGLDVDVLKVKLKDEAINSDLGEDNDYTISVEGFIRKVYQANK